MRLPLAASLLRCATLLLLFSGCAAEPPPQAPPPRPPCCDGETPLEAPASGSDRLEAVGDTRTYALHLIAGHFYSFISTDGLLTLYSPDGKKRDTGRGFAGGHEQLAIWASEDGTYRATVTRSSTRSDGSYEYSFEDLGPDDYPSRTPTRVELGVPVAGRIEVNWDADSFTWPTEARRIYQVTATNGSGLSLRVTDPNGEMRRDSIGGEELSVTASAPSAESMQATIYAAYRIAPGPYIPNGPYALRVDALGWDDHGDYPDLATELTVPTATTAATFDFSYDKDGFRFSATATHRYRISCTPQSLQQSCKVETLGCPLDATSTSYATNELLFRVRADGPCTFFLSGTSGAEGPYTYSLEDLGPG